MILSQLLSERELNSLDKQRLNHLSFELAKEIAASEEIKKLLKDRVKDSFKRLSRSALTEGGK